MRVLPQGWLLPSRKRVLDAGLFGHADYLRFIVLGRSRVGSNLLRSLLNAHPQVVTYGEVFRDAGTQDWDHVGYFQTPATRSHVERDPVRFLDRRLFGRYPQTMRAVGFKLFYYHARDGVQADIWPWLVERRDIRVIHLKRENLLQTHVSRKRAALTGRWVNTSRQPEHAVSVRLEYEELLADFEQTRAWETEGDRAFAGHPMLQVQYEQLASDYQTEARRLEAFLGVAPHVVQPATFQQSTQSLSATVSNYRELKARFEGSPWTAFFTD